MKKFTIDLKMRNIFKGVAISPSPLNIDEDISCIYLIKNIFNQKAYVGKTKNLRRRWREGHIGKLRRGCHYNKKLQEDWKSLKEENFIFEILEIFKSEDENYRCTQEEYFIEKYDSFTRGYNYGYSSKGVKGNRLSPELVEQIKQRNRGINTNLTEENIVEIKTLLRDRKFKNKEIAELFNVTASCISSIKSGKNWSHIKVKGFKENKQTLNLISDIDIQKIKEMLRDGFTQKDCAEKFSVSKSYVGKIHQGKIGKELKVKGFIFSNQNRSKLLPSEVLEIVNHLKNQTLNRNQLSKKFNVSFSTITDIIEGKTHSRITGIIKSSILEE